jgi:hypothetical protein
MGFLGRGRELERGRGKGKGKGEGERGREWEGNWEGREKSWFGFGTRLNS